MKYYVKYIYNLEIRCYNKNSFKYLLKMEGYNMILERIAIIVLVVQAGLMVMQNPENEVTTVTEVNENYCCFCDDNELTTKQKCQELLWKVLTDEKNWLDDGMITKEVYELQIQPFNKALEYIETATEEEIQEVYTELLLTNLDWLEEDKAVGKEIDEGFYDYIISELEKYN